MCFSERKYGDPNDPSFAVTVCVSRSLLIKLTVVPFLIFTVIGA